MVEEKLAAVFRAMKKEAASTKKDGEMEFKLRVVDLLEHFARCLPRVATLQPAPFPPAGEDDNRAILFEVLPALLEKLKKTQHTKSVQMLNQKLTRIVTNCICEIRECPALTGHEQGVNAALRKLFHFAARGNPTEYMLELVERCVASLIRLLNRDSLLDMDLVREGFVEVLHFAGTKKHLAALNVEKFLLEIWKRCPETGLKLLPALAEASTDKRWSQVSRVRVLNAMADLVMKHGKLGLIKDAELAVPAVQSVERVLLAWLRYEVVAEGEKVKPTKVAVLATSLGHLRGCIRVLLDPRVTGSRYTLQTVFETLPNRSDVIECLNKLLARYPALKGAAKVQKEVQGTSTCHRESC
jgi:hypothetical protein